MMTHLALALITSVGWAASPKAPAKAAAKSPMIPVPIPGGAKGIGFDDLGFDPESKKILVPGGRTGKVFLVDPATRKASGLSGFTAEASYSGGHGEGVTSVDAARGLIFAADRSSGTLAALDPKTGRIVASAALNGKPDYVRFVEPASEVWVTEPDSERIEIFAFSREGDAYSLKQAGGATVQDGPESLVVDAGRGRAYTNTWKDETVAIDLKTRAAAARWRNGCANSRGIALDKKRGFVFVGCEEGRAAAVEEARGRLLSIAPASGGVDVIAYDEGTNRLFVPGARAAEMTVFSVSGEGRLTRTAGYKTARGAHCVAADDRGGAWVCDPDRGRLLYFPPQRVK